MNERQTHSFKRNEWKRLWQTKRMKKKYINLSSSDAMILIQMRFGLCRKRYGVKQFANKKKKTRMKMKKNENKSRKTRKKNYLCILNENILGDHYFLLFFSAFSFYFSFGYEFSFYFHFSSAFSIAAAQVLYCIHYIFLFFPTWKSFVIWPRYLNYRVNLICVAHTAWAQSKHSNKFWWSNMLWRCINMNWNVNFPFHFLSLLIHRYIESEKVRVKWANKNNTNFYSLSFYAM